jgi:hypothetical protein
MGSDPYPSYAASFHDADGAIVISDPDSEQVVGTPQLSEVQ